MQLHQSVLLHFSFGAEGEDSHHATKVAGFAYVQSTYPAYCVGNRSDSTKGYESAEINRTLAVSLMQLHHVVRLHFFVA